jgi:hypothetical protein
MTIELGDRFFRKYISQSPLQSIQDAKDWQLERLNDLPESYKKYGKVTLYIKRIYPDLRGDYKPKWHKI